MDYVHDRRGEDRVVLEYGFHAVVENGVVGHQEAGYELFDDEEGVVLRVALEPGFELIGTVYFGGAGGAYAVVGLGNYGVAGLFDEGLDLYRALGALYLPGGGNASFPVVFFHLALVLDGGDAVCLYAGSYVEICPQAGVLLQPVFVVGLYPVYLSVFVGEPCHGAVHVVVIFQVIDLVVVREAVPEALGEVFPRGIGNAQDVDSVAFGPGAELPVAVREMWGDEY